MKSQLLFTTLSLAILSGCGADKKQTKETEGGGTPVGTPAGDEDTALLLNDEGAAGQAVTAQIDDAISAAVEENENEAGAALDLADTTKEGKVTRFRDCKEDGATAVVSIKRNASREVSFEGPKRKIDSSFVAYYDRTRTWSKDGGSIKCGENKKFAALQIKAMAGVKLDVLVKNQRSRTVTLENKVKNVTAISTFDFSLDGSRHAEWKSVDEVSGVYQIQKEVTGTMTRKLDVQNKKGEKKSVESTVTTAEGKPLEILVERDKATLAWASRTIQSGTRIATGKDGGRIETTFADVKYTRDGHCDAVSGKITGGIFAKDATDPTVTFEINFDADGGTIVYSNGKESDYSGQGCDLDESETVTEAPVASDVTPTP